ncbi:GTP-binding Rit1 [Pelobates cultripes]|uniref:small monomeric GTPase n=1 Tax=Pelobates cultripes TaxID=61616 RepID=A0AAD1WV04_PELCU|nr:GTP-binding Rit1 [Pelobates cultripes]
MKCPLLASGAPPTRDVTWELAHQEVAYGSRVPRDFTSCAARIRLLCVRTVNCGRTPGRAATVCDMDSGASRMVPAIPVPPREYKLVMLGAGGVGKSAMTMQFISHRFPEDHDPTIEDAYKIRIRIDDEPANLDILDTAGQAEFTAMRDQYMRAGEGFIICYSITDRRSFHEAREFKQLIYRVRRTDDTPVVLVGNKSDLSYLRQVSKEDGGSLAREFNCPFFETSAAFRFYIDDVFHALVREIRRKERDIALANERKSKPRSSIWKRLKSPFRKKKESIT